MWVHYVCVFCMNDHFRTMEYQLLTRNSPVQFLAPHGLALNRLYKSSRLSDCCLFEVSAMCLLANNETIVSLEVMSTILL